MFMRSVREYSNEPQGNQRVEKNFNLRRDYLKKTLQEIAKKNLESS